MLTHNLSSSQIKFSHSNYFDKSLLDLQLMGTFAPADRATWAALRVGTQMMSDFYVSQGRMAKKNKMHITTFNKSSTHLHRTGFIHKQNNGSNKTCNYFMDKKRFNRLFIFEAFKKFPEMKVLGLILCLSTCNTVTSGNKSSPYDINIKFGSISKRERKGKYQTKEEVTPCKKISNCYPETNITDTNKKQIGEKAYQPFAPVIPSFKKIKERKMDFIDAITEFTITGTQREELRNIFNEKVINEARARLRKRIDAGKFKDDRDSLYPYFKAMCRGISQEQSQRKEYNKNSSKEQVDKRGYSIKDLEHGMKTNGKDPEEDGISLRIARLKGVQKGSKSPLFEEIQERIEELEQEQKDFLQVHTALRDQVDRYLQQALTRRLSPEYDLFGCGEPISHRKNRIEKEMFDWRIMLDDAEKKSEEAILATNNYWLQKWDNDEQQEKQRCLNAQDQRDTEKKITFKQFLSSSGIDKCNEKGLVFLKTLFKN